MLRAILIVSVTAMATRPVASAETHPFRLPEWFEEKALYSAAAAVTYGCVAAMNMRIRDLEADGPRNAEVFRSTFEMGRRVSPYLACARPIPWAALHISERSRNERLADRARMWREAFAPALGAFQVLKESHVPWVTLSDLALSKPLDSRTRVLVLPWPEELTDEQKDAVRQFESGGGCVIRVEPGAGWETGTNKPALMKQMARAIREQAARPPIAVEGPPAMHAVCYEQPGQNRLTVCLANTWGWFRSTREPNPQLNEGTSPPPPCAGVTLTVSHDLGSPQRFIEAVRGSELPFEKTAAGRRVSVPEFQISACVAAEY